ncbi:putative disease resistance protein RGA3 isoform X2 [Durio zibethinus]|uniref:Disease resistance protein RGA3 isoform X2 n=1 Tax=Durio zibethinus TaxID=66656 RepID=A0A6P5WGC8_DURZI|nr:putative disease resistance protein RGA3 isoform X2 [Durio zibethinus]XP_022714953.1 putative disease resistance protein RGA3 isoform X2 [Durio zibethinus]XP_022714954.1 putative disease resistance protein RGA3 isoform X2 [Durio zibethinus]
MAKSIVSAILENLRSLIMIPDEIKHKVEVALNLEEEIRKMTSHFQDILLVLKDAEMKQVKDASVRNWLKKLKDVAYDVDDVLDEWNTAKLKSQLGKEQREVQNFPLLKKIRYSISSCTSQSILYYNIASKIKGLNEQLDCITTEKDRYRFGLEKGIEEPERQITASFIDKEEVYVRRQETIILVNMLVGENSNGGGSSFRVISIVGMGGIGKTTLAQLVYNDNEVESHFDKRIWICVSNPFDEIRIAKEILEAFRGETPNLFGKDNILQQIRSHILGKKILLVLDDMWTEDATKWEQLRNSLRYCSPGSRILITTRKERVAIIMGTTTANLFPLHPLSQEECWSLLSHRAFYGRTSEECENLEDIGRKIAEKCQGLPLAAKILGGVLQFKRTGEQWQSVLDSEIWDLQGAEHDLFRPLFLSYYELPLALKQCISYCAVFPKDKILNKDELIKLWMAQDYLKGAKCKEMEIVGEEYFDKLKMHSFFQDFKKVELDSDIIECKMHDIVHDFVQLLTKTECLVLAINGFEELGVGSSCDKARHVTLICKEAVPIDPNIYCFKKLRSLLIDSSNHDTSSLSASLPKLFDQLTRLRTLNLSNSLFGNSIEELPDQIGKLVHLRYLNLKHNRKLKKLPESLCELCNLQTLNLTWCDSLQELPCGIGKLINLSHLENELTDLSLMAMPKGIGRLTNLQTLRVFVAMDGGINSKAASLGDLRSLIHLRGHLKISGLGVVWDVTEAKKAELQNKKGLRSLILDFTNGKRLKSERPLRRYDEILLKALQPPPCLEKLEIWYYSSSTIFPNWMLGLTKLQHISLGFCFHLNFLPPLGKLPSLESLYIGKMRSLKEVGVEFLKVERQEISLSSSAESSVSSIIAFPSLKHLEFSYMKEWHDWIPLTSEGKEHINIMPWLCSLTIDSCPKLSALPYYVLQNKSLEQLEISQSPILSERCRKDTGEDWLKISHIPSIIIDGLCMQANCSSVEEFGVLQLQPLHSPLLSSINFHKAFQQN